MKVLFANRKDCLTRRGGDTTQMLLTKKYLETMYGLDIEFCFDAEELLEKECDIVHIFNVQTYNESAAFIKSALQKKFKIVLSPIYWNYNYAMFSYALGVLKIYKPRKIHKHLSSPAIYVGSKLLKNVYQSKNTRKTVEYIIDNSDILLPNSNEELEMIQKHFKLARPIHHSIVPNAIELPLQTFPVYPKDNNIVIQVGTIIPGKNQMGTLLSLIKEPEIKIYFVGRIQDFNYYQSMLKIAKRRGNVFFTGELSSNEVNEYYQKAKVHVLPSFGETTALVSLEAMLYGCEIVVSNADHIPVKYYKYDEIGHICNPFDTNSIKRSILNAIEHPKYNAVKAKDYFDFFNYSIVAEKTYNSYLNLLLNNRS